ncbi:XRE family transcriptional regulator [Intrasporangium oryzae NRRL B-24470]|uniref:XRE family transcriptional regulator n=1 Tax=Intrasporangium oryzae NRRL B-24470 TaxID=1386089 RepID=W9G5K0_9MICO|nr:helix-turn-helix domain-containing protein [Intrasporangium oryzae]EWT00048.1 XRE family transcriptional regulator [Intrasporangium oryzae NRRL B-24470]
MEGASTPGEFAVVLRRLRESRSLTQEDLAERARLTAKAIGALERGERRRPYPHTVRSLADALALDDTERAQLVAAVPSRYAGSSPGAQPPSPSSPEPVGSLAQPRGAASTPYAGRPAYAPRSPGPAGPAGPAAPPLTRPTTRLIGREAELDGLRALVRSGTTRLVTVTGPGGVGKTRLVMELLDREAPGFPGGALAVDLSQLREPALVVPRVAAAFGLPEAAHADPLDALVLHLGGLRVLMVLDNLEHLTGSGPTIADLVARCPDLVVVATSRAPLRVRAEHEVVLAPLSTPAGDDVEAVAASPAVALLLDRAAAAGAPVGVTESDAPTLAAICRRLDGLPLALELAAPGLRLLSPSTLLARLAQADLGTSPRDLPARHRTMAAVLEWSMDLLEPEEVDLFMRLAVFSGGFSLDAVEAVAGGGDGDADGYDVLRALGSLVEQSLVLRMPSPDDQPRFRMLEPVRQFAMQRLHAEGRATATADRHAEHFRARSAAYAALLEGPELVPTLDRLEADHANLRSAYLRLLELDRVVEVTELAAGIWLFLALRGHAREGLGWLERVGAEASDVARCRALTAHLGLLLLTGDVARMSEDARAAMALTARVAYPAVTCETLTLAGQAVLFAGDLDTAKALLARALDEAHQAARPWVAVHARLGQAQVALAAGDLATAGALLPEVVASARELGSEFTLATALNVHATLTELLGDEPATAALLGEAVAVSLRARMSWTLGYALPALASVALRVGDPASAAWLFGASASISAADAVDPAFPVSRALSDRGLDATRAALGEAAFARSWDEGRRASAAEIEARAATVSSAAGA